MLNQWYTSFPIMEAWLNVARSRKKCRDAILLHHNSSLSLHGNFPYGICQVVKQSYYAIFYALLHTMLYHSHTHEHPTSTSLGHTPSPFASYSQKTALLMCPVPIFGSVTLIWDAFMSVFPLTIFFPDLGFLEGFFQIGCILNTVYVEIFVRRKFCQFRHLLWCSLVKFLSR